MTGSLGHGGPARGVVRVASYNVRDLLDDAAAAARVVRAIDPDVLCLQEVPRRLTTEFRLPAFARACGLWWSGGRLGTGGTAVLSSLRVHVLGQRHERLPVRFPERTRGFAVLEVSPPGGARISVASVHLGLHAEERVRHVAAILEQLGPAAVIAGDLNEDQDGRAWRMLTDRYRRVSGDRPTFPVWAPDALLDAIFAGDALTLRPGTPVGLVEEDVRAASDHRPVWVDFLAPDSGTTAMAPPR